MPTDRPEASPEILDVLIVGAGLSGIGAARRLQQDCPQKRYLILEARERIGGTWDLFRYPGVRSDSDMYTLGYDFKPWTDAKAIADGPAILRYVREAAEETGVTRNIRFGHSVRRADWSSRDACWAVTAARGEGEGSVTLRARFLYMCSGYYSYAEGYRPKFGGEAGFRGKVVDPQFWPEGLDYRGKRVAVIGSGATAVTIVPAMADAAAHVTMVQRSPTYVVALPAEDRIAQWLERRLSRRVAYGLARWKNVLIGMFLFHLARRRPDQVKRRIVEMAREQIGPRCDADVHFAPRYKPWDQRICLAPDGDLFREIRNGRASVVTDTIRRFTEKGLELESGSEIEADIVVMATGLEVTVLGDVALRLDGCAYDPSRSMAYKGMMLSDVPNLAMAFGYTNAPWTLKADLTAGYVCRLLRHMDRHGWAVATPRRDPEVLPEPILSFTSGYVQRALPMLPKQGSRRPWQVCQNYLQDLLTIRYGRIADGVMQFSSGGTEP